MRHSRLVQPAGLGYTGPGKAHHVAGCSPILSELYFLGPDQPPQPSPILSPFAGVEELQGICGISCHHTVARSICLLLHLGCIGPGP